MRRTNGFVAALLCAGMAAAALGQAPDEIKLPPPQTAGGKPLMQALKDRHSSREFAVRALPEQVLSNLLWAANGVSRPDGRRTAPSAMNWQEVDIYVVLPQGAYLFDAKAHALTPVVAGDLRAMTGTQPFVKDAPLNLVFVADLARMVSRRGPIPEADRDACANADTGFISQNVYLFCASEGLNTVVRGLIGDKAALASALKLRPDQRVILAQTVGYPK